MKTVENGVRGAGCGARESRTPFFALCVGVFFVLAFLKWGNPVVLDSEIEPPTNLLEFIYQPWPLKWAYVLLVPLAFLGMFSAMTVPRDVLPKSRQTLFWIPLLPMAWFMWQLISASQTIDNHLTSIVPFYFAVCALFFYMGYLGLRGEKNSWPLFAFLTLGLLLVIKTGFRQHFGGLEESLRFFKQQPGWENAPKELIERMEKLRVFSTFCYPNALAGALLLVLPVSLVSTWKMGARFSRAAQIALVIAFGGAGLACLVWSGSKAGWLLAVVSLTIAGWQTRFGGRWKRWLLCALIVAGLAGFFVKYATFFQKGSTSVVARFDYWKAALQITQNHPVFGSGPGTFFVEYLKLKTPESEPAKLCHNDYLQQASDSGIPGFLAFFIFIAVSLTQFYRSGFRENSQFNTIKFAVWLGLLGLSLHSLVEFHLYIPALAWPQFFLLGWMWKNHADKKEACNFQRNF